MALHLFEVFLYPFMHATYGKGITISEMRHNSYRIRLL